MSRRTARRLATLVATLTFVLVFTLAPAARAQCRIEPFGDSITYGWGSFYVPGGYRTDLVGSWPIINGAPHPIQMVGAQAELISAPNLVPLNQHYHSGFPGYTNQQLLGQAFLPYPVFSPLPYSAPPGIVLVHAGTNDIRLGDDAFTAAWWLTQLLTQIGNKYPGAKIIVAKIIPFGPVVLGSPTGGLLNLTVATYNAQIDGIVQGLNSLQPNRIPRYFVADMSTFPAAYLNSDGIHPTDLGYLEIANRWRNALQYVMTYYGC